MIPTTLVEIGKTYRTPYEPSGLFRVLEVWPANNPETAFGVFVGNHPSGYRDGEVGRYFTAELRDQEVLGSTANDRGDNQ